ncbi:MAG: shikimate kinase [Candidatus Rhabdochlamydia sp.]
MSNCILIGFKGSGKSTLGKKIGLNYGKPFIDTDDFFEEPASQAYQRLGKQLFYEQETVHLQSLAGCTNSVIATGGGVVCDVNNHTLLQKLGIIIHLHPPQEIIWQRVLASSSSLEFLQGDHTRKKFEKVYQERLCLYQKLAHYTVTTESELWQVMDLERFFVSPPGESPTDRV